MLTYVSYRSINYIHAIIYYINIMYKLYVLYIIYRDKPFIYTYKQIIISIWNNPRKTSKWNPT